MAYKKAVTVKNKSSQINSVDMSVIRYLKIVRFNSIN